MSIENQIERINQNISNTYTELEALGADAPDNKNSDNLAATVQSVKAILYTNQDLTEDQKEQARKNIGLDSGQNLNLTVEIVTVGEDSGEPVAVTGLSLDLTEYSAKVGGGFYINPVVQPANATNRSVTWKSDKPAVATVNGMGYVECIAEGDAVITCTTVDGGYTATCAVSVAAAESGGDTGGNSGGDNGSGTAGQKIQFSTLEVNSGALKADGTTATISKAWNVSFPYTDGMFVSTGTNGSWNISTYPPVLVLENGAYKAPSLTKADGTISVNGSIITQYSGILTGYSDDAVVYATILASGSKVESAKGNMDRSEICYYIPIPGGEN